MFEHRHKRFIIPAVLTLIALLLIVSLTGLGSPNNRLDQALQAMIQVKLNYVEPVSLPKLFGAYIRTHTINGMLKQLDDPYTRLLIPEEYEDLRAQTQGSFGGIGILIEQFNEQGIVIFNTLPECPGEAAGLLRGDIITSIGGRSTAGMTSEQAATLIRGPIGSIVRLTIRRGEDGSERVFSVEIKRDVIKVSSVQSKLLDDQAGKIGYITIFQFTERTAEELGAALLEMERGGARGFILDLRYNPGGLLEAAVGVAGRFLPENAAVLHMISKNNQRETYTVYDGAARQYPLVVLINHWSASAAEIVAGALRDHGAAVLVGSKTFGKGVVQTIVPLNRGAALSLTIAEYLTAGGHSIHKIGITPDVVVDAPGAQDRAERTGRADEELDELQLERAKEILRGELRSVMAAAS